jgi:hypothetical protein
MWFPRFFTKKFPAEEITSRGSNSCFSPEIKVADEITLQEGKLPSRRVISSPEEE